MSDFTRKDHGSIIRQTRNAIWLVLNGAVRSIEAEYANTQSEDCHDALADLFNNAVDEIADWEIPGTFYGEYTHSKDEDSVDEVVDFLLNWVRPSEMQTIANGIAELSDTFNTKEVLGKIRDALHASTGEVLSIDETATSE